MTSTRAWIDAAIGGLLLIGVGCGSVDPGEFIVTKPSTVPSPMVFGTRVHEPLVSSCGLAACHGRTTTFTLHESANALDPGLDIQDARNLPEPFRTDYFTVLAYCDPDVPDSSELILWGLGKDGEHPPGKVLSAEDLAEILAWLRGGGGNP